MSPPSGQQLARFCHQFLTDNKAEEIITINLRHTFPLADFMLIASGGSARHTVALAQNLIASLGQTYRLKPLSLTGLELGEWVLLDLNDVVVHIFQPITRDYYQLEKRWIDS
ncbi:MAG: ribosome silencing factor [Alphaproteobacteria bacterium]|nr:ribosome silencing factor [Alphaproteobacteria bacterium]